MSAGLRTYRLPGVATIAAITVMQQPGNAGATPVGYVSAAKLAAQTLKNRPRICTHKRLGRPRETADVAEIAAVYNEALAGGKPAQAVAERFQYERRTIGRRIRLARQMGLITAPAPRGGRPRGNPAS
jgi:hypothetical protein